LKPGKLLNELWRLIRPQQWIKSGFVLMGALFANAWRQPGVTKRVLFAAAAFALVSSGVYVLNDLLDRENDLNHPTKKNRPIAAKTVSIGTALVLQVALWVAGLVLGFLAAPKVALILVLYILINILYSVRLKHAVLLDVFSIAAGFMLRILAGTTGIGIAPSQWLLLCGLMMALFLGFAKRRAELYARTEGSATHRKVLDHYQPVLLDKMIVVTATCVILTYSLYTMSPVTVAYHHTESLIYTVPFVMYGIFRYVYLLHRQISGSDPATEIFRDPHLLVCIVLWLLTIAWLIY
jgi:4-hydroxybenzoate polyprenyltransferase